MRSFFHFGLILVLTFLMSAVFPALSSAESNSIRSFETMEELDRYMEELRPFHDTEANGLNAERSAASNVKGHLRTEAVSVTDRDFGYPTFTSSFQAANGQTYPFQMVGHDPKSGKTAKIPVTIIPIKLTLKGFASNDIVIDPKKAVDSVVASPLFNDAPFHGVGGRTQYVDALQRCAFWNEMDKHRKWSVRLNKPKVASPLNVVYTSSNATLSTVNGINVPFLYSSPYYQAFNSLKKGQLYIFVCPNCKKFGNPGLQGTTSLSGTESVAYVYGGWFDPKLNDVEKDVSVLSGYVAQWANQPTYYTQTPAWKYDWHSQQGAPCGNDPYLDLALPTGCSSCNYKRTSSVKIDKNTFSVQNVVFWQWFTGAASSNTCNKGWTYPKNIYDQSAQFC